MKFLLSLLSIDSFKKFCREIIQRQTPTKGHSNKQDKSPHGGTLLFPFAPCRRMGQRAAVRNYLYPVSPFSSIPVPSPASPAFQPGQDLSDGAGMLLSRPFIDFTLKKPH